MPDTLSDLLASVGSYKSGADAATQQMVALTSSQAALSQANSAVYSQQGTDSSVIEAAAQAAGLKTQAARVKVANAFHSNMSDVTEQYSLYAAAQDAAQKNKDAALSEIARKSQVSIFDNPLEYIMNQFTVNGDIAKHNAANAQVASAKAAIDNMNSQTSAAVQIQNQIAEPITAASAAAAASNAAAAATVAANKSAQEGLSYNVNGVQAALNARKEDLGNQFSVFNARKTEQQISISLQTLEMHKAEFAEKKRKDLRDEADYQVQEALGKSMVTTVNRGRASLGLPALDDISGKMLIAQLKGKSPLSTQMQRFYDAGQASETVGINMIGSTPASAAATLSSVPNAQLNSTQGPIKTLLANAVRDVSSSIHAESTTGKQSTNPALIGLDKKDIPAQNAAMSVVAQQRLNIFAAEVKVGDTANPYQIASIGDLGANSSTVAALPVYQKVFAPLVAKGVPLNDPAKIDAYVGDAVSKGIITHAQALEMTTIYHVGVKTNLAMRNLPGFGLIPSLSYNAQMETDPGGFHATEIVDRTDPGAYGRALIKRQSSILREALSNGGNSIFTGTSNNQNMDLFKNPSDMTLGSSANTFLTPEKLDSAAAAITNSTSPKRDETKSRLYPIRTSSLGKNQ